MRLNIDIRVHGLTSLADEGACNECLHPKHCSSVLVRTILSSGNQRAANQAAEAGENKKAKRTCANLKVNKQFQRNKKYPVAMLGTSEEEYRDIETERNENMNFGLKAFDA